MSNYTEFSTLSPGWGKDRPYPARLTGRTPLTSAESDKDVRHFEFGLGDSGITYEPGDTVSVLVRNSSELATEILHTCGLDPATPMEAGDYSGTLLQTLTDTRELTQVHPGFIKRYAEFSGATALQAIAANASKLRDFVSRRQIADVIGEFPARLSGDELLSCLRQLMPRQYSIASSQKLHPDSVALTINMVRYPHGDAWRYGAGSHYLGWQMQPGDTLPLYVVPNAEFRLPADDSAPVIMIGPGTGIAPFRAFLQERQARKASGRNWLFFGNPHRESDFLYGAELLQYEKDGLLTSLDLAFSRDQAEKRYVQHLMLEKGKALFSWLEAGAHVYVCGDARHMAEDVQKALLTIIETHAGLDAGAARQYLVGLRRDKRYQRDVY
jgi:sulfite reductase (NADPH) flavoprotein alpha-component